MADVQRQIEQVAEKSGHAQQHAENEITRQRAVMPVHIGGESVARFGGHDFAQQRVDGQPVAQIQIVGAVVEKSGDDARTEQPQSGNGGIPQGRLGDDVDRFHLVSDRMGVQQRLLRVGGIGGGNDAGQQDSNRNVAEHGHALRAAHVNQQLGELVFHRAAAFVQFDLFGKAGGGHGGLFGGDGAVQHVYQHKTDTVVQTRQYGCGKLAETERTDMDFMQRHQGDQNAAARRGKKHIQIFALVAGDVVFAVLAFVFGDAFCQHPDAASAQVACAVLLYGGIGQRVQQGEFEAVVFGVGLDVDEQFQPIQSLLQTFQQVRHLD